MVAAAVAETLADIDAGVVANREATLCSEPAESRPTTTRAAKASTPLIFWVNRTTDRAPASERTESVARFLAGSVTPREADSTRTCARAAASAAGCTCAASVASGTVIGRSGSVERLDTRPRRSREISTPPGWADLVTCDREPGSPAAAPAAEVEAAVVPTTRPRIATNATDADVRRLTDILLGAALHGRHAQAGPRQWPHPTSCVTRFLPPRRTGNHSGSSHCSVRATMPTRHPFASVALGRCPRSSTPLTAMEDKCPFVSPSDCS